MAKLLGGNGRLAAGWVVVVLSVGRVGQAIA